MRRLQNEKVINAFLDHQKAQSPKRSYVNGYYMDRGSSISTDGETLYSYNTPIAKWDGCKVLVDMTKYSMTTTMQQYDLRDELIRRDIETGDLVK